MKKIIIVTVNLFTSINIDIDTAKNITTKFGILKLSQKLIDNAGDKINLKKESIIQRKQSQ